MPDTKLSALAELTALADVDELLVVDKSDVTMAASGTSKRVTRGTLTAPKAEPVNDVAASGAAQTIPDPLVFPNSHIVLTAACTVTLPAAAKGASFTVALRQDATGGWAVTWAVPTGTSLSWPGGTVPALTTAASKMDMFTFVSFRGNGWAGMVAGQNYA